MDKARKTWHKTVGEIRESEVISYENNDGETRYTCEIVYEYLVRGQSYQSSRLEYLSSFGGSRHFEAAQLARRYHTGRKVTVYYNPRQPAESVLTFSALPLLTILLGGSLVIGFGWIAAVFKLGL